jgi:hypothetical protein
MLPSLQRAASAPSTPAEIPATSHKGSTAHTVPFDSAMSHALARDSEPRDSKRPPAQARPSRGARQRTRPMSQMDADGAQQVGPSSVPVLPSPELAGARPAQSDSSPDQATRNTPAADTQLTAVASDVDALQALATFSPTTITSSPSSSPPVRSVATRPSVPGESSAQPLPSSPTSATINGTSQQLPMMESRPAATDGVEPGKQQVQDRSGDNADDVAGNSKTSESATTSALVTNAGQLDVSSSLQIRSLIPTQPGESAGISLTPAIGEMNRGAPDSAAANGPPLESGNQCPDTLGISAAQEELPMKKAQKMQKNAEPAEQDLPGHAVFAREADSTTTLLQTEPLTKELSIGAPNSDPRLDSLEKTHELVALHALRLSRSNHEELRIVIEPGSGTRLSLELRLNNGAVEAQAVLHHGDYEFLNQHWAELQQRLEPRGVHLSALETSSFSLADQRNSQQPHDNSADGSSATPLPAIARNLSGIHPVLTQPAKTYAGWETWA